MKLFNNTLLVLCFALMLCSCEKETNPKGTIIVSDMSFDFSIVKGNTKVSNTLIDHKVNEGIGAYSVTKASKYELVNSAQVYTLYSYASANIKEQLINTSKRSFEVPSDDKDYFVIFLAKALNSLAPVSFKIPNANKDKINKALMYKSSFNENLCYAIFNNTNISTQNEVEVIFTPVFSQLELSVPAKVGNDDLIVKNVTLLTGVQETANVFFTKSKNKSSNKNVNYERIPTDFKKVLDVEKTTTNGWGFKGKYYNLVPNSNPFKISVTLVLKGKEMTKEIELKNTSNIPTKLLNGTRYRLSITNQISGNVELSIFSISNSTGFIDGGVAF